MLIIAIIFYFLTCMHVHAHTLTHIHAHIPYNAQNSKLFPM